MPYNRPAIATYLGINDAQAAAPYKDGVILASTKGLYQINYSGQKQFVAALNNEVNQIKVLANNNILLPGETTLSLLSENRNVLKTILYHGSPKSRIDSNDQYVAYLVNQQVTILDLQMNVLVQQAIAEQNISDIALYRDKLLVVGWSDRAVEGLTTQVPYLHQYSISSKGLERSPVTLWDYSPAISNTDLANSRIYSIQVQGDKAIVLGESRGKESVLRGDGIDSRKPTIIKGDRYANAYNAVATDVLYLGVIDLSSMRVERGQFLLARKFGGRGADNKTFVAESPKEPRIDPNESDIVYYQNNTLYISSIAYGDIPKRQNIKIGGRLIPAYSGGDASFMGVHFQTFSRLFWTTPGKGIPLLLTSRCAIARTDDTKLNITPGAVDTSSSFSNDTYMLVW